MPTDDQWVPAESVASVFTSQISDVFGIRFHEIPKLLDKCNPKQSAAMTLEAFAFAAIPVTPQPLHIFTTQVPPKSAEVATYWPPTKIRDPSFEIDTAS